MDTKHPIEKKPEPLPHDPRNEPIPEKKDDERIPSLEEAERKARKEEGLDMKSTEDKLPTGKEEIEDEYGMPTGIQTGQNTSGSYSTDPVTGAGGNADHRAGKFSTEELARIGNDQVVTDPIDPKL